MRSVLPLPPPFCQQGIWSVAKLSTLSKAKELIKTKLGRSLDSRHRLLSPHHRGSSTAAQPAEEAWLTMSKRNCRHFWKAEKWWLKRPCGSWWERGKSCPVVSPLHGEALMPNAAQMEVVTETGTPQGPEGQSTRPQPTQATRRQPKPEQTEILSPPRWRAMASPSILPLRYGAETGKDGRGERVRSGHRNGSVPRSLVQQQEKLCMEMGKDTSLNLTDFSLGGLLVFKSLLYFGFTLQI